MSTSNSTSTSTTPTKNTAGYPLQPGMDWVDLEKFDIPKDVIIERELVLIKVACNDKTRPEIVETVDIFRGRIVDVAEGAKTLRGAGVA